MVLMIGWNTFNHWKLVLWTYANSADPVQMPQYATDCDIDQGLHCLLAGMSMQNTAKMKTSTRNP